MSAHNKTQPIDKIRLDKWLWTARFYKTRSLSSDAVEGGKVKLNGQRTKPAHAIKLGDKLNIVIGEYTWQITVLILDSKRGAAPIAQTLYQEDSDSHARRQAQVAERKQLGQMHPVRAPNKKDRREITKLKQISWGS